jgi:hypothetical protein
MFKRTPINKHSNHSQNIIHCICFQLCAWGCGVPLSWPNGSRPNNLHFLLPTKHCSPLKTTHYTNIPCGIFKITENNLLILGIPQWELLKMLVGWWTTVDKCRSSLMGCLITRLLFGGGHIYPMAVRFEKKRPKKGKLNVSSQKRLTMVQYWLMRGLKLDEKNAAHPIDRTANWCIGGCWFTLSPNSSIHHSRL